MLTPLLVALFYVTSKCYRLLHRGEALAIYFLKEPEIARDLKREIARMWNMRTVQVVPIVVGSLGSVTKSLDKWLGKLNIKISISLLQKTALLGTARILRKVLEL